MSGHSVGWFLVEPLRQHHVRRRPKEQRSSLRPGESRDTAADLGDEKPQSRMLRRELKEADDLDANRVQPALRIDRIRLAVQAVALSPPRRDSVGVMDAAW